MEQHQNPPQGQSNIPARSVNDIPLAKNGPMNPTPLEFSCWSTYPNAIVAGAVALFVSASITIGVLIVYLTIPKATIQHCRLNFKQAGNDLLDYSYNPRSVAIADFNNDTWLDFVVANRAANNISVFLATGNGTFGQLTTYSTGSNSLPNTLAVADLNNDQHPDIVVAYFGSNNIGIFLGLGNGSFVNHTTFSTGSARPIWIHIAHLDNDTFRDLVTADYGTDSISIFSGDGTGKFSHRMTYSTGYDSSPVSVVSGDFNHDNRTDLAVANSGTNSVGIFFRTGSGNFSEQMVFSTGIHSHPNSIAVGYLNRDVLLDIAIANYGTNSIGVFLNTGSGTFDEQTTYMLASPYAIVVTGINKDEQPDLIVASIGANNIGILLGHGNGSFAQPITLSTGSRSSISVAVGDLNKDDLPDVVVVSNDTNSISISLGNDGSVQSEGTYSFATKSHPYVEDDINDNTQLRANGKKERMRRQYGGEPCTLNSFPVFDGSYSVAVGDFNNDNHLDIVAAITYYDQLGVFLGYGNGSFANKTIYRAGLWPSYLKVEDFNGDALLDIIVHHFYAHDGISVLLGYGNGSFANPVNCSIADFSPRTALDDFNNDTILDLVVVNIDDTISVSLGYGNGSFANPMIYATGSSPWSVVTGDCNDDAILDLVVVNHGNNSVGVFIGYGNGSFANQMTFSTGNDPIYATVGNFNDDNSLDIVVLNNFDNTMQILLGYGNGSFANHIACTTGKSPNFAAVADFNEDGQSDVVVANYFDTFISVFTFSQLQFTTKVVSSGSGNDARLQCIAANDFNNDNILDIVVANYGTKTIGLLLGHGNGSFKDQRRFPLDSDSNPQSITIGDFNADSQLDLAVANGGTNKVDTLLGNGMGDFARQRTYGYGLTRTPSLIVAADFNHDGRPEVVVAYDNSSNIDVLAAYDTGNFTDQITYSIDDGVNSVIAGDFNGDRILDLVVNSYGDNILRILLGYGDGSFANPMEYAAYGVPKSVAVGDFNNDTHLDIVVTYYNDKSIGILLGYGNGSFANQTTYPADGSPWFVIVSDFNNDHLPDIAVLVEDGRSIKVLLGHGNGSFAKSRSSPLATSPSPLSVGDVNNDMFMDIVFVSEVPQDIHILLGYGNGSFQAPIRTSFESGYRTFTVAVGDFNNDARLDIVLVIYQDSIAAIFLGYGNGSFAEHTIYSVGCGPSYVVAADLNDDAQLDIVTANSLGKNINVLLGDGTGSFTSPAKYSTGLNPHYIVIGDFNNDTRMDIVVGNVDDNSVSILFGKFNQVFKRQTTLITDGGSSPRSVTTGDFNNDTHPDIAVVTNSLGVFLGHGNGSFSTQISSLTVSSPSLIAVGDLNSDAHLDVVVVSSDHSGIAIHLGDGNGSFANYTKLSTDVRSQPKSVSVADFDNDTILDIIIANSDPSHVVVFVGDDNGSFSPPKEVWIGYGTHPFSLAVGDFNNDKKLDFAVANYGTDNLQMYLQTC